MQPTNAISCTAKPNSDKMIYSFDRRRVFEVDPKYRILKFIDQGAYGMVASGENIETKQKVAIKLISDLFKFPSEAKRELR